MIEFFDYFFYLTYKFYLRNFYAGREKRAATASAGLVGGQQATNVIVLLIIVSMNMKQKVFLKEIIFIIIAAFFQIVTYFRYIYHKENNGIQKIEERWQQLGEDERKRIRRLSLLYFVASNLLFLVFGFYWLGQRTWKK